MSNEKLLRLLAEASEQMTDQERIRKVIVANGESECFCNCWHRLNEFVRYLYLRLGVHN